jgi:FkbM family methyltransferase
MKSFTKKILRHFNLELKRINPNYRSVESTDTYFGYLAKILSNRKIDLVLDVGASTGNWASQLIDEGCASKIISFEPLSSSYKVLKSRCSEFTNWECYNFAIGDITGQTSLNISKNNESSSISKILNTHIEAFPESQIIREESIEIKTIDNFLQKRSDLEGNIFAKVDVQGFEKKVLTGASYSLDRISILQLEMGLEALYHDELLFCDWLKYLKDLQFHPLYIQNAFSHHETKKLLQVDCIFLNESFRKS